MITDAKVRELCHQFIDGEVSTIALVMQLQLPKDIHLMAIRLMEMPEAVHQRLQIENLYPAKTGKQGKVATPKATTPERVRRQYIEKLEEFVDYDDLSVGDVSVTVNRDMDDELDDAIFTFTFVSRSQAAAFKKAFKSSAPITPVGARHSISVDGNKLSSVDLFPPEAIYAPKDKDEAEGKPKAGKSPKGLQTINYLAKLSSRLSTFDPTAFLNLEASDLTITSLYAESESYGFTFVTNELANTFTAYVNKQLNTTYSSFGASAALIIPAFALQQLDLIPPTEMVDAEA